MCNNTIKITVLLYNLKKSCKMNLKKNKIFALHGQRLANNYNRQIQRQNQLTITFCVLK